MYYDMKVIHDLEKLPIANNHIIFAFYKGKKSNLFMKLGAIIGGIPVESLAIFSLGKFLRIKSGYFTISDKSISILKKNYYLYDTRIDATPEFNRKMELYMGKEKSHNPLNCTCIRSIEDLLCSIDKKYKPSSLEYIPSFYLKKCMKLL